MVSLFIHSSRCSADEYTTELRELDVAKSAFVIPDEENIADYYELRQQLDILNKDLRDVLHHPTYALPFLQPGRLVRVKHDGLDFGWGCVVNYQKRLGPKVRFPFPYTIRETDEYDRESLSPLTNRHKVNTSSTSSFIAPPEPSRRLERKDRPLPSPPESDRARQEKMESLPSFPSCSERSMEFRIFESFSPRISNRSRRDCRRSRVCRRSRRDSPLVSRSWIRSRTWESSMMRSRNCYGYVLRFSSLRCAALHRADTIVTTENRDLGEPSTRESATQRPETSGTLRSIRLEARCTNQDSSDKEEDSSSAFRHASRRIEMS